MPVHPINPALPPNSLHPTQTVELRAGLEQRRSALQQLLQRRYQQVCEAADADSAASEPLRGSAAALLALRCEGDEEDATLLAAVGPFSLVDSDTVLLPLDEGGHAALTQLHALIDRHARLLPSRADNRVKRGARGVQPLLTVAGSGARLPARRAGAGANTQRHTGGEGMQLLLPGAVVQQLLHQRQAPAAAAAESSPGLRSGPQKGKARGSRRPSSSKARARGASPSPGTEAAALLGPIRSSGTLLGHWRQQAHLLGRGSASSTGLGTATMASLAAAAVVPLGVANAMELIRSLLFMAAAGQQLPPDAARALQLRFSASEMRAAFEWLRALGWVNGTARAAWQLSGAFYKVLRGEPALHALLTRAPAAAAALNAALRSQLADAALQQPAPEEGAAAHGPAAEQLQARPGGGVAVVVGASGKPMSGPLVAELLARAAGGQVALQLEVAAPGSGGGGRAHAQRGALHLPPKLHVFVEQRGGAEAPAADAAACSRGSELQHPLFVYASGAVALPPQPGVSQLAAVTTASGTDSSKAAAAAAAPVEAEPGAMSGSQEGQAGTGAAAGVARPAAKRKRQGKHRAAEAGMEAEDAASQQPASPQAASAPTGTVDDASSNQQGCPLFQAHEVARSADMRQEAEASCFAVAAHLQLQLPGQVGEAVEAGGRAPKQRRRHSKQSAADAAALAAAGQGEGALRSTLKLLRAAAHDGLTTDDLAPLLRQDMAGGAAASLAGTQGAGQGSSDEEDQLEQWRATSNTCAHHLVRYGLARRVLGWAGACFVAAEHSERFLVHPQPLPGTAPAEGAATDAAGDASGGSAAGSGIVGVEAGGVAGPVTTAAFAASPTAVQQHQPGNQVAEAGDAAVAATAAQPGSAGSSELLVRPWLDHTGGLNQPLYCGLVGKAVNVLLRNPGGC